MRSFLIIGLGRFGTHLALKLMELGNEVMIVDKNEDTVNNLASHVTRALVGDCMEDGVLESLGVSNFDFCFVCISDDFQSSLEITSLLKDLGARTVISKTNRDIHAKFLLKIGADHVIYPERDMAQRAAFKYSAKNAFDYIELTPEYAIIEVEAPVKWIGKTLRELDIRSRHNINVIGRKTGDTVIPVMSADHVFEYGEHLVLAGSKKDLLQLMDKN